MPIPMSYLEFKVSLEIAYVDTFEKDDWVQEQYQKYLLKINPPKSTPVLKKDNGTNSCR